MTTPVTGTATVGGISYPVATSITLPTPTPPPTGTNPVGPSGNWLLTFNDEFSGTSLNPSNWTALNGGSVNNIVMSAANVSVSGNQCQIKRGGMINSSSVSGYSGPANGPVLAVGDCCEAKINFPGPSGDTAYNWPAWWTSGAPWPSHGENDIFESYNGTPSALNYHSPSGANNGPFPSGSWCNSFHTYTCVRGKTAVSVYWDGVLVRTVTPNDNGGTQALMITVGSGNTESTSAVTLVDYVRVWSPA